MSQPIPLAAKPRPMQCPPRSKFSEPAVLTRRTQGLVIALGSAVATIAVLAAALAWGPHHCEFAFPTIIGCAIGQYETLAGGMIAAATALFAGWLAWSGVQSQIESETKRLATDRAEVEDILQGDLDYLAEGLATIWKILDRGAKTLPKRHREAVVYGLIRITGETWIGTARRMVTLLSWDRRRYYEDIFAELERLRNYAGNNFNPTDLFVAIASTSRYFALLRPEIDKYFDGRFDRKRKVQTLGWIIRKRAGIREELIQTAAATGRDVDRIAPSV